MVDDFNDGDHARWSLTNIKDVGESGGVLSGTSSNRDPQMVAPLEPPVKNGQVVRPLAYAGPALVQGRSYYWRIRFWDNHGAAGQWSDWVELER